MACWYQLPQTINHFFLCLVVQRLISQKATAEAAATLSESTPWAIGMRAT